MGNRIFFDKISKQLRSIYGVTLRYVQDNLQDDNPYLVRNRQFERVVGDISKKTTNGFIRFKSLHRTQDVILHHGQGETCDLSGKMYRLALAQVQQGLAILVCNFSCPASGIKTVCFEEAKGVVGCKQTIPVALTSTLAEEQAHRYTIQLNVHHTIGAAKRSVVLTAFQLLLVLDDLLGIHLSILRSIVGLAQFYNAQQVTLDMSACNEAHELCVCKPAIYEQVIKTDTSLDGVLDHVYGLVRFLHQVFIHALLYRLALVVFGEASLPLLGSESLDLLLVLAFLSMKREVKKQLADSIGKHQGKALVTKNALLMNMGPDSSDEFRFHACLGSISIINNQTNRFVLRGSRAV